MILSKETLAELKLKWNTFYESDEIQELIREDEFTHLSSASFIAGAQEGSKFYTEKLEAVTKECNHLFILSEIAKQRLGPAGYQVLEEVQTLRTQLEAERVFSGKLREALNRCHDLYADDHERSVVIKSALALPRPGDGS